MVKRLIIAVVLLAVIVGGIVGFNRFRDQMIVDFFANRTPAPVTVSTSVAEPITWRPGIEAIGTAIAAQGVDLAVEAGGTVREILFRANEQVEEGQKLLQISEREERADLAAAEAALELAETELERARALQERGVSAVNNLDTAQAQAASARAQVAKIRAQMQQKELVAPFNGVIGIPQVDVGGYVTPGTIYATLQDLDAMRVDFALPEQQIGRIKSGLPVSVVSEAGGYSARGEITGIEPKVDPNSRLVTVRAEVANETGRIYPGQFLRVRVELPDEEQVIALPQTALMTSLYGDSVYVVRAGEGDAPRTVEQVFVQPGRRDGQMIEIVSGLEPGDEVVNAGQNRLSGGAPVTVDNTVQPMAQARAQAPAQTESE
ncbi:efflux RND transporter periplasmic adaptor subunit [Cereibacter azotoformans]|uniref:Membrane fusion protein (Multidrug efflux system) n=2 Tax=Cereibacter TaxID=1653176 RepID=A0A2T5K996_9RHOB|nr:efflux RND transporter periplasmic adaptor subunit [Cereibacter azotoformans]AXQ95067.1 efflux RND transporter periplasmic adaptor subunit [Cereibacter sphaeroides]MBO4169035.1 efflux RND transporter periplasmic adaptor subunit [Cereibacter azotoformans]PTR18968.1 membrane fusion protein (multidrug efflux system) [Cereibacter azotoformans]UIJ31617.1 efflux RND transporter periplasmic adaptor subunit [Cereibacter azotoformans]ULB09404.1 efflux RND transporter periplasmic adaptor subunit [Cer